MKEIIKDICKKLEMKAYHMEEHVRIGIVARICQSLGWNIWDPAEFYTELPVPKLRAPKHGVQDQGNVDVALIKLVKYKREKHVFFEVKSVNNMYKDIRNSRGQLEEYSLKFNVPLSILTDGRKWEFYLNSLPCKSGYYQDRIINSVDLIEDDIEEVILLFNGLLSSKITSASLIILGKRMHKEYVIIKYIKEVKNDLENLYPNDVLMQIREAVRLINQKHGKGKIKLEEVTEFWNSKIALGGLGKKPHIPPHPHKPKSDYTGMIPLKLFVIDKWYEVPEKTWATVKKITYEIILAKGRNITLEGRKGVFKIPETKRRATRLFNGSYIDTGFCANDIVKHCLSATLSAGYNPKSNWKIETVNGDTKKERQ